MSKKIVIVNVNLAIETPCVTEEGALNWAANTELPGNYVEDSYSVHEVIDGEEIPDGMTTQQARDEFINLRSDDPEFANLYGPEDFNQWLDDYQIGLSD